MQLIDSHTHLYLEDFDADREQLLADAALLGIKRFLLPHIDSKTSSRLQSLAESKPDVFYPMMGLHPCSVDENWKQEMKHVEEQLANGKYFAVGEIGIDLYWDKTHAELQEKVFIQQIHLASELNLPIVIHSRESTDAIIAILKKEAIAGLEGVFHCFSGTADQGKAILDLGFFLGIGGVLTFKNSGLSEQIRDIPLDRILLETDSPYLAPAPYRGKRNVPVYLMYVAEKLAELRNVDLAEIAAQTTANTEYLFKLPLDETKS